MTAILCKISKAGIARTLLAVCCLALVSRACAGAPGANENWLLVVDPENSVSFSLLHGPVGHEATLSHIGMAGWGPKWAWTGIRSSDHPEGDFSVSAPFVVNKAAGEEIDIRLHVSRSGSRAVVMTYDVSANKDVPITILAATLGIDRSAKGSWVASQGSNKTTLPLPLTRGAISGVSRLELKLKSGEEMSVDLNPPMSIGIDGDLRLLFGQESFPAGHKSFSVTFNFPENVTTVTSQHEMARFIKPVAGDDWFAFRPSNDVGPSVIGMEQWLERPAGKRGGVRMVGDHFQFEDGTPIKFWGLDLSYGSSCAPPAKVADFTAARFAKYGVNAVRLHKFTYPPKDNGIGDANDSTQFDAAGLDRLDYFTSQLKSHGVYTGWSHTYGHYIRPGDRAKLLAYDEIAAAFPHGNTYAFINFAPDVQDLMIQAVVNLLKHTNPYTKTTYANESALCYIELQNEDDIFFFTSGSALAKTPTYRKQFGKRFCDWLMMRYGSEAGVKKAWGSALLPNESLAAGDILPVLNPYYYGQDNLPKTRDGERRRLLDGAAYLHDVQNQFYGKFVKAIRDAGYQGPINGSPWQAPGMLPHFYNLKSDYLAGYIDRHNYFGGKLADTMLGEPGSGYLSSGLQQVIDRPFGVSEWIHVYPSLYSAEGPALVAAYGMGLQGWDASYEFQSSSNPTGFSDIAGNLPWGVWNADTPTQIGQYPSLARMIYRGDVRESPVISIRKVTPANLAEGQFDFTEKVSQHGDIKSFGGAVSAEAIAAGRVVVEFADQAAPSTFPDMTKYRQGESIVSSTGQLTWNSVQRYVTINTDGAKGVVGFAKGKEMSLGSWTITSSSDYASIVVVAADPKASLADGSSAIISAIARSCNTGFTVFGPDQRIFNNGKGPILLEPVKASFNVAGRSIAAINILDHDGRRTGKTVALAGNAFNLDTARDQAIYYEVVFGK